MIKGGQNTVAWMLNPEWAGEDTKKTARPVKNTNNELTEVTEQRLAD